MSARDRTLARRPARLGVTPGATRSSGGRRRSPSRASNRPRRQRDRDRSVMAAPRRGNVDTRTSARTSPGQRPTGCRPASCRFGASARAPQPGPKLQVPVVRSTPSARSLPQPPIARPGAGRPRRADLARARGMRGRRECGGGRERGGRKRDGSRQKAGSDHRRRLRHRDGRCSRSDLCHVAPRVSAARGSRLQHHFHRVGVMHSAGSPAAPHEPAFEGEWSPLSPSAPSAGRKRRPTYRARHFEERPERAAPRCRRRLWLVARRTPRGSRGLAAQRPRQHVAMCAAARRGGGGVVRRIGSREQAAIPCWSSRS